MHTDLQCFPCVARPTPVRTQGIGVGIGGLATVPAVWLGLSAPAISRDTGRPDDGVTWRRR